MVLLFFISMKKFITLHSMAELYIPWHFPFKNRFILNKYNGHTARYSTWAICETTLLNTDKCFDFLKSLSRIYCQYLLDTLFLWKYIIIKFINLLFILFNILKKASKIIIAWQEKWFAVVIIWIEIFICNSVFLYLVAIMY